MSYGGDSCYLNDVFINTLKGALFIPRKAEGTTDHVIQFLLPNGFPSGSDSQESACNVGDLGSIPGLGRSTGEGHGNPLQYSCLENPHGERSLAGYSPQGHKESDTTE